MFVTGSCFTRAFSIGGWNFMPHESVELMVQIPIDQEAIFEKMSGCKLRKVARLRVGMNIVGGFNYLGDFANLPRHSY